VSRKAIQAEGIAEAKGIQEMNNALAGSGGDAIQGKRIMLLPVSEDGMNLKTTDINRLIETLRIKALSGENECLCPEEPRLEYFMK
jgi:hypothetical protein